MAAADQALWFLTAALSAIALARLGVHHLWRTPPLRAFAFMLLVSLLRDLALYNIPYTSPAYAIAWEAFLPLLLLSHGVAAFAAYRAVVSLYPKMGRFAVWLFASALAVAALACLGTLPWELRLIGQNSLLRSMFLLYRWVDGLSAGALLLSCGFLAAFPRPMKHMPSNLLRHTALLAAYFAVYALVAFTKNLLPLDAALPIERANFALVALFYAAWTLGLSKQGERCEPWEEVNPAVAAFLKDQQAFTAELVRHAAR